MKTKKEMFESNKPNEITEATRVNKYLAESGICSRREADKLVADGKVKIDGETAVMGSKVLPGQKVTVEGQDIKKKDNLILIAFNKPVGIVSTTDRREKDNIIDYIKYPERIFPIGRLDKDSEGLILLTNDGDIVNKILRAGNHHEKEYIVTVNKDITDEFLKAMAGGVPILDTVTKPCKIEKLDRNVFKVILTQGLNRQIRRMCEALGYRVRSLMRVRIMNVRLNHLKTGTYRNLTPKELEELRELIADSSNAPASYRK
jgi:23S rRNA pseudouridine2604 synthase